MMGYGPASLLDMMFWLIGADEPVVQNVFLTHFKMLKNFKQFFLGIHMKKMSIRTKKFRIKRYFV